MTMQEAEEAAKILQSSMKGFGTEQNRIIKVAIKYKNEERQIIKQTYLSMYGRRLDDDLKNETGGSFMESIVALFMIPYEYEAQCLRNAIRGFGTNEKVCIQLLCTKEANEIQQLKAAYTKLYQHDLEKDIEKEEGGPLGRLFRSLAQGLRPKSNGVDLNLAKREAQELFDAGQGRVGTDDLEFVRVLCTRSYEQLNSTFEEYYRISNVDIEKAIEKELNGDLERACLAIVKCVRNRPGYFAVQLHEAFKGFFIKYDDVIRILVTRSEIDLQDIKREFRVIYGKSLFELVKKKLSGYCQKLFLELIGKDDDL